MVAALTWHLTPALSDLIRLAVADLAATLFIFGASVTFNNSSMYDPYWSVKPAVIAIAGTIMFGAGNTGSMALLLLMVLYGLRLTINFYRDWPGLQHEDWRYVEFRQKFTKSYWLVSLFGIHLFPTIQVYLACLPVFLGMKMGGEVGLVSIIGIWVTLFAIWLAYEADAQMRAFRSNPLNKGRIMDQGLWKHSRHPNYLGEILTWWGVWLITIGIDHSLWWTGIGALSINIMFHFVSIPMMDRRSTSRRPEFAEHITRTNALLPIPKANARR
jgi:steroid 5-alpha reductase family enzyme